MKRILNLRNSLIMVLAATATSCGKPANDEVGAKASNGRGRGFREIPEGAGDPEAYHQMAEPDVPMTEAAGIDLNNDKGVSPFSCMTFTEKKIPNQYGVVDLAAKYSMAEISEEISGSASASGGWGPWSASAKGAFMEKVKSANQKITFIVRVYSKTHSKVYIPTGRSEFYKDVSPEQWNKDCGQGYVAAQDFGGYLAVFFEIDREAYEKATEKSGSAGGSYLGNLFELKAAVSKISKTKTAAGTLTVRAVQFGGRPADLGKILKGKNDKGMVESLVMCELINGDKCLEGIRNIESYISDEFPAQMLDKENGGPIAMNHYAFRYPKSIGADSSPMVDQFVKDARVKIGKLYESESKDIQEFVASGMKDDDAMLVLAKQNLALIRQAAKSCYTVSGYNECSELASKIEEGCARTMAPSAAAATPTNPQ